MCFSLQISATFFYQIWLTLSAFSFRSDLFNISCWKDANFAPTLAEPPVVLLLVVDVDHVAVADAQLVVPGRQGEVMTMTRTIIMMKMTVVIRSLRFRHLR